MNSTQKEIARYKEIQRVSNQRILLKQCRCSHKHSNGGYALVKNQKHNRPNYPKTEGGLVYGDPEWVCSICEAAVSLKEVSPEGMDYIENGIDRMCNAIKLIQAPADISKMGPEDLEKLKAIHAFQYNYKTVVVPLYKKSLRKESNTNNNNRGVKRSPVTFGTDRRNFRG